MRVVPVNDNTSPATLPQSILPLLEPFCADYLSEVLALYIQHPDDHAVR